MNMKKIMAAGVAATMAVTSLAAVASAETLTFNMKQSTGNIKVAASAGTEYGDGAALNTALATPTNVVAANDGVIYFKGNEVGVANDYATLATKTTADAPVLTIKGLKKISATQVVEATATFTFKKVWGKTAADPAAYNHADFTDTAKYTPNSWEAADSTKPFYYLVVNTTDGEIGEFVAAQWARIDTIKVDAAAAYETPYESFYNTDDYKKTVKADAFDAPANDTAANGAGALLDAVKENVNKIGDFAKTEQYLSDKFAMMKRTTAAATIYRQDVQPLSTAGAHTSGNVWGGAGNDGNQSYNDNGLGDTPKQFAGLASQVADFFNHKTNGTITFKFTTVADGGSGWTNGGVPSTQVGIKNLLNANNFALYVNYMSSTGSLEATTSVDKSAGTVTFDISEILADLGGQTKGVINDLYYGLNVGIDYPWPYQATGLLVEEVTLAYEDEAEEEDVVDEEEEVAEEEEEEEEVAEEEEEEVAEEEEEEEVDGDMVDEEPAAEDEAADENPGTGVALAVVPAIMAAAAVVVSKKRK